jgi:hypothetical protein
MAAPQQGLIGSAGGDIVSIPNLTVLSNRLGGEVTAGYRLDADGGIYQRKFQDGDIYVKIGDWVLPNSSAPNYECSWTAIGGTVDSPPGPEGTFLALTSDRTWEETAAATTFEQASFTARVRRVSTTTEFTGTITLQADGTI